MYFYLYLQVGKWRLALSTFGEVIVLVTSKQDINSDPITVTCSAKDISAYAKKAYMVYCKVNKRRAVILRAKVLATVTNCLTHDLSKIELLDDGEGTVC